MSNKHEHSREKIREAFYEDGHILDSAIDRISEVRGEVIDKLGFAPLFVIQQKTERFTPRINLLESGDSFHASIELPGFDAEMLELTASRDMISLSGERKRPEPGGKILFLEQLEGSFSRKLRFNTPVDGERCRAVLSRGILQLSLPKLSPEEGSTEPFEVMIHEK